MQVKLRTFLPIVIVIALTGFWPQHVTAQKWGKITKEEWNMPLPADFPAAGAIVLFDRCELRVDLNEIEYFRHVRIKVFNKAGMGDAAEVEIGYRKDDRIVAFKAHTIAPDGRKTKVKEDQVYEKVSGPFTWKVKTFAFPAVQDGVILEYQYKNRNERFHYIDPWAFQSDLYTIRSEFSLILRRGYSYRFLAQNLPEGHSQPVAEDYRDMNARVSKFTWILDDIPPMLDEPLAGYQNDYSPALYCQLSTYHDPDYHYSFATDWGDLGEQLATFVFEEYITGEGKIRTLAEEICAGAVSKENKPELLYNYVRDRIETRDPGYRWFWTSEHDHLDDMLKTGYGTSVEKNLLLVELLRAQGFEAYPLLIGTRDYGTLNPSNIQFTQFNHTICYLVGAGISYALDTGDDLVPFPFLPAYDLVDGGLRIDGNNSTPVSLPLRLRKSSREISSILVPRPDGSACCSTTVALRGYETAHLRLTSDEMTAAVDFLKESLPEGTGHYETTQCTIEPDTLEDCVHARMVIEYPELYSVIDGNLFVPPLFSSLPTNFFTEERRSCPVDFQYPCETKWNLRIMLPAGAKLAEVPEDKNLEIPGMRYSRVILPRETSVEIVASMAITDPVFTTDRYAEIVKMFETMVEIGSEPLVITLGN